MSDIFDFTPKRQLYAVFGNPISHSKSPLVHSLFAKECGIDLEYRAEHVEVGGFEQAVSGFQANGGNGLNVTVPFKINAWKLADHLTERANLAGAVNTLTLGQTINGDNTDGPGLVTDIESNLGIGLDRKLILIIGAGGAVRGILYPILERQPNLIVIANRTKEKATLLADTFAKYGDIRSAALDQADSVSYDIVINATSTGIHDELPGVSPRVFQGAKLAYDLMYGKNPTRFIQWADENGAEKISDGLGMLVEQAAESFEVWQGVRPQTIPVISAVREQM